MRKITHISEQKLQKPLGVLYIMKEDFFQTQDDIKEKARVGFMEGHYEVYVHTDDRGNIPHVHISKKKLKSK